MFHKILNYLALLLGSAALLLSLSRENIKVGYVYNSRILSEYEGVKEARMQYRYDIQQWQANLDTLQSQLNNDLQVYERSKMDMAEKERLLTEQLITRKRNELVNYKNALEQKAAETDREMTAAILRQVDSYLLEYGKEHGYDYLFGVTENGNILYANEADDLTEEVLRELNVRYKGE